MQQSAIRWDRVATLALAAWFITLSLMRLNVLATHLGLPRRTIESVFEPDLMRLGLVTKTDSGRILTSKGISHVGTFGPETV